MRFRKLLHAARHTRPIRSRAAFLEERKNLMNSNGIGIRAWGMTVLAWLVPGLGHVSQGLFVQGALLGAVVCALFFTGVVLGGHLHIIAGTDAGILSKIFWFCNLGNGLLFLICGYAGIALQERPMLQFSEYGNVFLVAAGLLNYFLMLDAFDTAAGRKF
jgi:hypothetical protein